VPSSVFVLMLLLFLYLGLSLGISPQDDTFISLRYADHLANGHGLVFNTGERVEGYTCFLWIVLLAAGMKIGIDPLTLSRFAGLGSGLLLLFIFWLFAGRMSRGGKWWPLLTVLHLSVAAPLVVESVQGMETLFFSLLVALGAYIYLYHSGTPSGMMLASLVFALAYLARPEGGLFYFIALVHLLFFKGKRRHLPFFLLPFLIVSGTHMTWRFLYYGRLLPNTFQAKVGWNMAQFSRGWHYLTAFAGEIGIWRLLAALCVLFQVKKEKRTYILLLPFIVCSWLYVILIGGDFKFTFRFLVPTLGFFLLCFQEGLRVIFHQISRFAPVRLVTVLAVLVVLGSGVHFYHSFPRCWGFARARSKIWLQEKAIGLWLREYARPGEWLATGSVGVIPFYSKMPTVDMAGLTDAHIARVPMEKQRTRLPAHEKGDGAYVLAREPAFILFQNFTRTKKPVSMHGIGEYFSSPPGHGLPRSEEELRGLSGFRQAYSLHSVPLEDFYFTFFQKNKRSVIPPHKQGHWGK